MGNLICYPLDVLRVVMQVDDKNTSTIAKVKEILEAKGISGL